ncbi:MAG: alpha/beta hydrolase [Erysipelotrichaceae bacterium]|nr:alpha/beta hydrolase [Erysipelotrichaceae bacterium]
MIRKSYETPLGMIRYWTNEDRTEESALVFLPGLTADHHLFDKQFEAFEEEFRILSWDAPGHAESRPFTLDFSLMDKAVWLHEILQKEGIKHPVLIGQSMGGYVSQCFLEKYPGEAAGFISIDSAPLKRQYVTAAEIWALKRTEPMYRAFPWGSLRKLAIEGCSKTEYGRKLMEQFVDSYTKDEYCSLSGHGMKLLAEAMEADLPYAIDCPAVLICGEKDQAGSAKSYNRRWAKKEGLPVFWIKDAGHNANTDKPEEVNQIIREFVRKLKEDPQ